MFYRPDKIKKLHNKWSPYFKNAMVWNLLLSNALSMFLECVLGSAKLLHKNKLPSLWLKPNQHAWHPRCLTVELL